MNTSSPFNCTICGQTHPHWPALTYPSPTNYHDLTDQEKTELAHLDTDTCIITYPDQTDRFIRTVLRQRVIDHPEPLEYGLWTSLSETSFTNYTTNYNITNHYAEYFGWLCNPLPEYDFSVSIPLNVITGVAGQRPEIFPKKDVDHPFVRDYYTGITREEVERRIHAMLNAGG